MESARTIAAWFPQTSPAICELWGLPPTSSRTCACDTRAGSSRRRWRRPACSPMRSCARVALAGDPADARERIAAVADAGADSIHVFPLGANRMQTVEAFAGCVADVTEVGAR